MRGFLRPATPEDLTDCCTLLIRLLRLEKDSLVRLQQTRDQVTIWAQPLSILIRREVRARLSVADRTVSAGELLAAISASTGDVALPAARDAAWRITLPPRTGWSILDAVPVEVLRDLADDAGRVVRAAQDPAAAGEALLDRETLYVSRDGEQVALPMSVVVVLNRLGFLGAAAGVAKVACTPAWTRIAARHGTAYQRRTGPALTLA